MSVPKVIHCFWAQGEKSRLASKCLNSWRKFAPGYEIREHSCETLLADCPTLPSFVDKAIKTRKWAFVADWARFVVLKREGGVYLDLDVELIAPFEGLPHGEWVAGEWHVRGGVLPNPGSGIALAKGSAIADEMLGYYETNELSDALTVGEVMSLVGVDRKLMVLPPEVLSPIDTSGNLHRTSSTIGIHWYAMSWASPQRRMVRWLAWHGFRPLIDKLIKIRAR